MFNKYIYHIIRGCGNLPTFGHHPGTPVMLMFIIAFTIATGWHGLFVSCFIFLPIYLWSAYQRSVEDSWDKGWLFNISIYNTLCQTTNPNKRQKLQALIISLNSTIASGLVEHITLTAIAALVHLASPRSNGTRWFKNKIVSTNWPSCTKRPSNKYVWQSFIEW